MLGRIYGVWSTDMKKYITGIFLPAGMILMFFLMLSGAVYTSDTGEVWTHITIFQKFTRQEIMAQPELFSAYEICKNSNGARYIYAPLCVMLPLVPVLVMERKGGARRYQIARVGKVPFAIGKMCAALFTGGMTLAGGVLLYCGYVAALFPQGEELLTLGKALDMAFCHFIYGAVLALPGYVLSIFVKNIYLVYCIPFIMNYLSEMFLGFRIVAEKLENMQAVYYALRNLNALNIKYVTWKENLGFAVVQAVAVAAAIIFSVCYLNRKTDCGV